MGVPEARMNKSRKGSRLCLNSTRLKDSTEVITIPDSAPSSPELRNDKDKNSFLQSSEQESSQSLASSYSTVETNSVDHLSVAPVASFYNLGNTCFLNCMLHVLRYTPGFVQLLRNLRKEIDMEEKQNLIAEETPFGKSHKLEWQLLRNMDDLYTEMSRKEFNYKQFLRTSSLVMALRPTAFLDSIRRLNPLFEGNMQHDAQELLRCLLCGLDDAELNLRRIKQKRIEEQNNLNKPHPGSGDATYNESPGQASCPMSKEDYRQKATRKQPALKGGRRRIKKEVAPSAASKGILASFLKAKEIPGIITKVDERREPIECTGLDKGSDFCMKDIDAKDVANYEGTRIGIFNDCTTNDDTLHRISSSQCDSNRTSPLPVHGGDDSILSDVVFCGESGVLSSTSPNFESGKVTNTLSSSSITGHDSYLASVKQTEGRRSRLGVRGGSRTFHMNENKFSTLSVNFPEERKLRLSQSNAEDSIEPKGTEQESSMTMKVNSIGMDKNAPEERNTLSAGSSCSKLNLPTHSSTSISTSKVDEIVDITLSSDDIEISPISKKERKNPYSHCGTKLADEKPLLSEGSCCNLSLTPGKNFIIHSPLLKRPLFYTPPPKSRSLLTRFGHFLPNSARRVLSFSSDDPMPARKSSPHSLPEKPKEMSASAKLLFDKSSDGDLLVDENDEDINKAQVHLRRCDWLGVSPVKSVSARYVLTRISNSGEQESTSGIEKRETTVKQVRIDGCEDKPILSILRKRSLGASNELKEEQCDGKNNHSMYETQNDIAFGSSCPPRPKRFKSDYQCKEEVPSDTKPVSEINTKHLRTFSINLEKCDWLMRSGETSVSVNAKYNHKSLKIAKKGVHESLKAQPSSSPGQPVPRLPYNFFGGIMSHQTRCSECETISDQSEEFLDISIPVPKRDSNSAESSDDDSSNSSDNSVSLLLQSLTSRERIFGDNKYFCENCYHHVEAERSSHITKLPKVLALHLKRFHANSSAFGGVSKINDHVAVPRHLPCLLDKCPLAQPTCSHGYSLYAVVTHSGSSIRFGHYRTYVRAPYDFSHIAEYQHNDQEGTSSLPTLKNVTSKLHDKYQNDTPSTFMDTFSNYIKANDSSLHSFNEDSPEKSLSWWLECDDDYVQVLDENEFFGKLSQNDGYLLGTPYILFYHQT